jgi:glycosyltransferase involved in cell wall biosynthesis
LSFGENNLNTSSNPLKNFLSTAIVMITKNEELAIEKVLTDCTNYLPGASIFVVDGSDDNTATIARGLGAKVFQESGKSFGSALHQALKIPGHEFQYIVTIDADDTYPAEYLPILIELIEGGFDIANGNRLTNTPTKNMPLSNWIINIVFNLIATYRAGGERILDVHSGLRAYRREVIHNFEWDYKGSAFPIDLFLWPILSGFKFTEIDIPYRERLGDTKLHKFSSGIASVKRLFRSRRYILEHKIENSK